jgi:hypothetical protein
MTDMEMLNASTWRAMSPGYERPLAFPEDCRSGPSPNGPDFVLHFQACAALPYSQWNVAVLLPGIFDPLVAQHFERADDAYATQVETLRRRRHGAEQCVRVEHVHINAGGQAVIGNVRAGDGNRKAPPRKSSGVSEKRPRLDSDPTSGAGKDFDRGHCVGPARPR